MQRLKSNQVTKCIAAFLIKHPIVTIGVFSAVAFILTLAEISGAVVSALGLILLIAAGGFLYVSDNLNHKNLILLMFFAGVVLRLQYILYTGCTERQHDVEAFGCGYGHAGLLLPVRHP